MKTSLEQKSVGDVCEKNIGEEEKEEIIEKIENDESLDIDTRKNAQKAVEIFSVGYDEAIKIAETVNLLWTGQKRFEYNKGKISGGKTRSRDEAFIEKIFPIAYKFKGIEIVNEIPKEIVCDIVDFKSSYYVHYKLSEFKKSEENSELLDFVESEINIMTRDKEENDDEKWKSILGKLDQVNINDEELKKNKRYAKDIITIGLIDYYQKQENIKERKINSK